MPRVSSRKPNRRQTSSSRLCELHTSDGAVLLPYEFRRCGRSKYLVLSVTDSNQVVLRVPSRTSKRSALDFLRSQADWVIESLDHVPQKVPLDQYLTKTPWISVFGRKAPVSLEATRKKTAGIVDLGYGDFVIRHRAGAAAEEDLLGALLEIAREVLPMRVEQLARKVDADSPTVRVGDQRTLWGSCTSCNTLSLNWRLLVLPPSLQDYIIYHELAHLTYLDHSPRFYDLLQSYDPKAAEHDHLVSKRTPEIMLLGRRQERD